MARWARQLLSCQFLISLLYLLLSTWIRCVLPDRSSKGGGCVYLRVDLHVELLFMVVPQLLGGFGFFRQVRLLPFLDEFWMFFPASRLTLAVLHEGYW